jgi:hypothetical protein
VATASPAGVSGHGERLGRGSVFLVARVWEIQARGVLHVHPVLAYGTARQMAGARAYLERLAELAPQYGFGFVERKVKPQPAVNAAAYLSSYFVKGQARQAGVVGVGPVTRHAAFDHPCLDSADAEDRLHDAHAAPQARCLLRVEG